MCRASRSSSYAEIARLEFTGKDRAAGKHWEDWVKAYNERKAAGRKEYRPASRQNRLMESVGRVQDCSCIALTPEVQEQTGLYPGATFRIKPRQFLVIPIEIAKPSELTPGVACG